MSTPEQRQAQIDRVLSKAEVAELADLKAQWRADPCWDIETTPGFDAHRDDLLAYRLFMQKDWADMEACRLQTKADNLGCSTTLVVYLESVERRLSDLAELVERMDAAR